MYQTYRTGGGKVNPGGIPTGQGYNGGGVFTGSDQGGTSGTSHVTGGGAGSAQEVRLITRIRLIIAAENQLNQDNARCNWNTRAASLTGCGTLGDFSHLLNLETGTCLGSAAFLRCLGQGLLMVLPYGDIGDALGISKLAGKLPDILGRSAAEDTSSGLVRARNFTFGDLPDGTLGSTDENGNITIQRGLTGKTFEETLRHETVHSVLTPPAALNQITTGLYRYSGLYRYGEEAAAETYGTGSLWQGLRFPITYGYVSVPRLGAELAGVGAASYGIYEWAR